MTTFDWNRKLLAVVIIVATILTTAHHHHHAVSAYPTDCSGDDGFYPSPTGCDKFFRCVTGVRYDFDCAPGTHFNPLISVCDWPNSAGCQGASQPPSPDDDGQLGVVEIAPVIDQQYGGYIASPSPPTTESNAYVQYHRPQYGYSSQVRHQPQYPQVYGSANEFPVYQQQQQQHPLPAPTNEYMHIGEYRQPNYDQHTETYPRKAVEEIVQTSETEADFEEAPEVKPRAPLTSYVVYEKNVDTMKARKTKPTATARPPPSTKGGHTKSAPIKTPPTKGGPTKSGRLIAAEDENADNSIIIQPKVVPDHKKKATQEGDKQKEDNPLKTLPKCEPNQDTTTAPVCTLDNFEWLSIADTEISSAPTKLYRLQTSPAVSAGHAMNDTMQREVLRQVGRQCEHYCNTLLQSRATNYSISCVGFTYTSNSCRLFSQLELEIDWLPRLLDQVATNQSQLATLRPAPGSVSRVQLPRKELVDQRWLLTETEVPADYFEYLKGNNQRYKEVKRSKEDRPVTLSDCLKACQKKGNKKCRQFVFASFEGKCYLRREAKDKEDKDDDDDKDEDNVEGWQDKQQQQQQAQNKVLVADVVSGENVEPTPTPTTTTTVPGRDKKKDTEANKPNMAWHFYEETDAQMLDMMIDLIQGDALKTRPIGSIENVSDPVSCREDCLATWQQGEEGEDKTKCHFIAVQEETSKDDNTNKTYTCHMYAEEVIELATELLRHRQEQDKASVLVRNSTVVAANFSSDQDSDRRHQKRDTGDGKSGDKLKAYLFTDRPSIRYDSIDDHETIAEAIAGQSPSMEWNGMSKEDKCLSECLEMFTGERRCRLLVTRKVKARGYNCTFYDIYADTANTVAKAAAAATAGGRQRKPSSGGVVVVGGSGSGGQRFEIHSYPYQVPTRHSEARDYFNVLATNDKTLVPFHHIDNAVHINDCLHFCVRLWIEPDKDKFGEHKCQHVEAVRSAARQQGNAIRYNCTLSDIIDEDEAAADDDGQDESVEAVLASPEDQVTLQLRQLPNRSLSMSEYQPLFNWSRADNETRVMLTHYRPNYLLDFQTDYRHCLKVCVDHWLRLRMGDRSNQDRCRLVVVGQSLAKRPSPPQAVAGRKTLYQCAFYDFDNLDSMLGSREKAEEVKIFIMNKTYLRYDRPLPATINRPMLNNLENRSVAFYHRSRAAGVGECVQLCRRQGEEAAEGQVNDVWKENKCRIVVAMPLVRYDATVDRNMTEYTCAFYDINLDVKFSRKRNNGTRAEERRAFQLRYQPKQVEASEKLPGQYFAELDGQSDQVGLTMDMYRPVRRVIILTNTTNNNNQTKKETTESSEEKDFYSEVQNDNVDSVHRPPASVIAQCLIECLRHNQQLADNHTLWQRLKERVDKSPAGDCSLVTIASGAIKEGRAIEFECRFYNLNLSRFERTDLDNPQPLVAYQLNTTDLTALITTDYKSRFYQINDTQAIARLIITQRGQLVAANATKNCLRACFYTWPMSLVTEGASRRCRFVTIRRSIAWSPDGERQVSYDCALYESGVDKRLHSLQVLVRPPKVKKEGDDDDDDHFGDDDEEKRPTELTSRGSEYKHLSHWPLSLPTLSEQVHQVSEPGTLEDCQLECDNTTSIQCRAVVALYEKNRLLQCYLIDRDYRVDYNRTLKDNQHLKVAVKISDLSRPLGARPQQQDGEDGEDDPRSPFIAVFDAVRRYEKNTPFAEEHVPARK